tara:strand:+ start:7588 stop:8070 length:483 start_codon:yes stop_codon:yes gene_type:complete
MLCDILRLNHRGTPLLTDILEEDVVEVWWKTDWKHITFSGSATGAILAILILFVFILPEFDPGSFAVLFGGWFSLALFSAFIVNQISKLANWPEVSLKILIPVGCITSVIPLFGPLFGMPNYEPITLVSVVAIGTIGGFFWSIPFAMWSFFSSRKVIDEE